MEIIATRLILATMGLVVVLQLALQPYYIYAQYFLIDHNTLRFHELTFAFSTSISADCHHLLMCNAKQHRNNDCNKL